MLLLDYHHQHDAEMERKVSEAAENGEVLRYVAVMDGTTSKCRVELRKYLNSHPFAQLQVCF
jgi:homoserine dehydrogenase